MTAESIAGPESTPIRVAGPTGAERLTLRILQVGAIAIVLGAVTYREFELDRFFVPKELGLHICALLASLLLIGWLRTLSFTRIDLLLVGFLAASILSAAFATNEWLALRAVTLSASSVALFWAGRGIREAGLGRPLLVTLAVAVVVGSASSLLQAYGFENDVFSLNRAPGGTLGNRNFIAHLAAFGFPVVLLCALRAWRGAGYAIGAVGVMIVCGTLVMTRSRAGWLAFGAAAFVFLVAMLFSRPLRRDARIWGRLVGIALLIGIGVAGVILLPNTLEWRSANPYLESVQGLANYQEGSGRGRLVQYAQSLRMAAQDPLLGVGPGNWPVHYPAEAEPGDPSLSGSAPGTTSNPWPSSDWVAFVSERGLPAALLLALALAGIALAGLRRVVRARDADEGIQSAALLATALAATVAGTFDAVLLLALPACIVWLALGLLWPAESSRSVSIPAVFRVVTMVVVVLGAGVGVVRSASQVVSMAIFTTHDDTASLRWAARIDPGNYDLHLRLAEGGDGRGRDLRCEHALAARGLFPSAAAARNASDGCED